MQRGKGKLTEVKQGEASKSEARGVWVAVCFAKVKEEPAGRGTRSKTRCHPDSAPRQPIR
jgi:hypothetical protein